ncbi:MAG: T9SS type A sorting domain-containing protein [Aequorivita sp.]|nr:T9SS type A sorting domain-containing protein [Aequorivita sp.]
MNKITIKRLIFAFLLIWNTNTIFGQCLPNGITFTTQQQIDDFPSNYPGCSVVDGNINIQGLYNITNLNGLSQIEEIGGYLNILSSFELDNLSGLDNLHSIGEYLSLRGNGFINLSGLDNLSFVGGHILIESNDNLESVAALSQISEINGDLIIKYNDLLVSLNGFENLTSISQALDIEDNDALSSLSSLQNLTNIEGRLLIARNNQLQNLNGLQYLIFTGDLWIDGNMQLNSLSGLEALSEINGNLNISGNFNLVDLSSLHNLTSVDGNITIGNTYCQSFLGLNGIHTVNGYVSIIANSQLTDINGIKNINASTITDLQIVNNPILSYCAVQSVCDFLEIDPMNAVIHTNLAGCNSVQEVQDACALGTEENQLSEIKIFPNPTNGTFEISGLNDGIVAIIDSQGRTVKHMDLGQANYSISELTSGIYFLKITSENSSVIKQLIKI